MKKIDKIKTAPKSKKLLVISIIIFVILFLLLIIRIAWLQFVDGKKLKETALKNQLTSRTLNSNRGSIFDSSGRPLAVSSKVDTVSVNPSNIKYSNGDSVNKEVLANSFSSIFDLNYDDVLEKLNKDSSNVIIAEKVEKDKITLLENWMKENKVSSGINIVEDLKRYYPCKNLASNLIGFTGTDGSGRMGLEYSLDDTLKGVPGKILTLTDSINGEIPDQERTYIEAENGYDVYLTIDVNIQSIAEKYLSQAVVDNNADGGNVIIMNPSSGDILAMATYPDYDLNTPFTPTNSSLLEGFDSLSSEEKNNLLFSMWKNKAVQDTYEPGSTFKLITSAAALEENIVTPDTGDFICTGSENVDGTKISCWKSDGSHGSQNLTKALGNSCNPAFIQLGRKVGARTLYKYYDAFGLFNKTSSNLYGESSGIFHDLDDVGEVELATMSFGQRFTITPLQLITAVSAIANEGVLMEPKIVDRVKNVDTGVVTTIKSKQVRQVISKETSEQMMDMLEYVVNHGTGSYAKVSGYSVGGKSGTSEPLYSSSDNGYIASFIGLSPTVNTQVVVLAIIYNPRGSSHQGGMVCGPVVSQILNEVLPYLGVGSNSTESSSSSNSSYSTALLPNVKEKTISEAKSTLESAGFNVKVSGNEDAATTIVTDQVPKPGASLLKNATVYLYTEKNNEKSMSSVPNFKGMTAAQAINSADATNLNLVINGSGIVTGQDVAAGKEIESGSTVVLTLHNEISGGY